MWDAVRFFGAFSKADEACRDVCGADAKQHAEDNMETIWFYISR